MSIKLTEFGKTPVNERLKVIPIEAIQKNAAEYKLDDGSDKTNPLGISQLGTPSETRASEDQSIQASGSTSTENLISTSASVSPQAAQGLLITPPDFSPELSHIKSSEIMEGYIEPPEPQQKRTYTDEVLFGLIEHNGLCINTDGYAYMKNISTGKMEVCNIDPMEVVPAVILYQQKLAEIEVEKNRTLQKEQQKNMPVLKIQPSITQNKEVEAGKKTIREKGKEKERIEEGPLVETNVAQDEQNLFITEIEDEDIEVDDFLNDGLGLENHDNLTTADEELQLEKDKRSTANELLKRMKEKYDLTLQDNEHGALVRLLMDETPSFENIKYFLKGYRSHTTNILKNMEKIAKSMEKSQINMSQQIISQDRMLKGFIYDSYTVMDKTTIAMTTLLNSTTGKLNMSSQAGQTIPVNIALPKSGSSTAVQTQSINIDLPITGKTPSSEIDLPTKQTQTVKIDNLSEVVEQTNQLILHQNLEKKKAQNEAQTSSIQTAAGDSTSATNQVASKGIPDLFLIELLKSAKLGTSESIIQRIDRKKLEGYLVEFQQKSYQEIAMICSKTRRSAEKLKNMILDSMM